MQMAIVPHHPSMAAVEKTVFPTRITIFTGYYGSGKTEIALHVARALALEGEKIRLVDLDFLKPVFRSREQRGPLGKMGVRLVAPEGELAAAEVPVMPCVSGLFSAHVSDRILVDLAGDAGGARAIAQFAPLLAKAEHEMHMVVNTLRPFASTPDRLCNAVRELEAVTRIRMTALLANTNLGLETTPEMIDRGLQITLEAAETLGLPVRAVVVPEFLRGRMPVLRYPRMWLQRRVLLPWENINDPRPD